MQQRSSKTRTSRSLARQSAKIYKRLQWNVGATVIIVCIAAYILSLAFYYNGRFFRQALTPKIEAPLDGEVYFNRQIYGLGAFTAEKSFIKWGEQAWADELYLTSIAFKTSPWSYLLAQPKLIAKSPIEAQKVKLTFKKPSTNSDYSQNPLFKLNNSYFKASELLSREHEIHIPQELRLSGEDFDLKRLSYEQVEVKLKNTNFHLHQHRHLAAKIASISGVLAGKTLEAKITNLSFNNDADSSIDANIQLNFSNQEATIQSTIKTTPISFITKAKQGSAWLQGELSLAQADTKTQYLTGAMSSSTDLQWQDNPNLILQSAGLKLLESKLVRLSSEKNLARCSGSLYKSATEFKGSITHYQSNYDFRITGDWHLDYNKHPNGALNGTMRLGLPRRDAKRLLTKEAYEASSIGEENAYRWLTFELSGFLHNAQDNIKTLIKP